MCSSELTSGHTSPAVDLEVETVMIKQQEDAEISNYFDQYSPTPSSTYTSPVRNSGNSRRNNNSSPPNDSNSNNNNESTVRLPGFRHDSSRKSAFSPYKPTTVLTNLQRGNIETQTPSYIPDPSIHQLAAQGELIIDNEMSDRDLDEVDKDGFTPLMWACYYGQVPIVNSLLARKVKINSENRRGENCLLLASCNGHSDIVKILLDHKMDVDHVDKKGNTALMYSAYANHAHCAQELLLRNADITKENHYGDTAFGIAVARGSRQVQVILERQLLQQLEQGLV